MERINKYLQIKHKLNAAADLILKEQKDMYEMATKYRLEYSSLHEKINIMNSLEKHIEDKIRYEKAVETVMKHEELITDSAEKYGVNVDTLSNEVARFYLTNNEKYEYDRLLDPTRIFTFKQEMLLLKYLELWKKQRISFCSCVLCSMEKLLYIAYKFARKNKINYPLIWNIDRKASTNWLITYEMTYSNIISQLVPENDCFRSPISKFDPSCYCFILMLRKKEKELQKIKKKFLIDYCK